MNKEDKALDLTEFAILVNMQTNRSELHTPAARPWSEPGAQASLRSTPVDSWQALSQHGSRAAPHSIPLRAPLRHQLKVAQWPRLQSRNLFGAQASELFTDQQPCPPQPPWLSSSSLLPLLIYLTNYLTSMY